MPFHSIPFLLVIVGIAALIRTLFGVGASGVHGRSRLPSLDVVEERYAKGEIQRGEYLQKRRDLGA